MVVSAGSSHNVPVSQYVVFFGADDDAVAAAVLPTGPGRVFTTVSGANFDADDAMSIWENVFGGRTGRWTSASDRPRMVAGGGNDGSAVYAMSDELSAALARAEPHSLQLIAEAWHADVSSDDEGLHLSEDAQMSDSPIGLAPMTREHRAARPATQRETDRPVTSAHGPRQRARARVASSPSMSRCVTPGRACRRLDVWRRRASGGEPWWLVR